jgi:hypothetical protein
MYFKNKEVTPYRIHELHQRGGLGGAAFDIFLNGEFANKTRNIKLSDIKTDFMMEGATDILKSLGNRESQGLYFYKDTMLLNYCCVDGSACRIGVSNMYIEQDIYDRPLDYAPHNIDTSIQAYGLLSLWLHWFKCAEIVLKINASEQAVQADTESRCPDCDGNFKHSVGCPRRTA